MLIPSRLFDQEALSDVTVKFGGRSVKCHKLVLSHASDHLKALCQTSEQSDNTIELYNDDPEAIEAMLKYIYNFKYTGLIPNTERTKWSFHLKVFDVALKYKARRLREKVERLSIAPVSGGERPLNASIVLEVIKVLLKHESDDQEVRKHMILLTHYRVLPLMAKAEFRALLESVEAKPLMDLVMNVLERGRAFLGELVRCRNCSKIWMGDDDETCSSCGTISDHERAIAPPAWINTR